MASSQFYSVCLAHESIRACRALLLASQCPSSRSLLHPQAMAAMVLKLPLRRLSFQSSPCHDSHGSNGSSCFPYRAFASVSSSPRTRKFADVKNPREEIRKLDEEIHRLERERRSVGKGKNAGHTSMGEKAVSGGWKRNAGDYAIKEPRNAKPAGGNRNTKFGAASGSSRNADARAMASSAQEGEEEEEDDDSMVDDDDDNDIADEDDEELGEDFSSDAEMYMETTDAEKEREKEPSDSASIVSEKPSSVTTEVPIADPIEAAGTIPEAPKDDVSANVVQCTKHPWKEWNDFYDVLAQKNYFKDVPPAKFSMEGEGYLRFQASSHMKHAVLEFSRERDDIIRFLTKKHIRTVVSVGCPSTDRKVVNACKRLRVLCEIPEDEVCQQCKLKTFCTRAFAAPSPDLVAETSDVARVVYSFALNASPNAESQVSYPVGVVKSVCHLIDEIVQLSAYPKDPGLPALKARNPVKPPVLKKDDDDAHHRPGDWTCPDCNFLNFSKNRECRECGTFRESAKQLEPGDWECPECTFVNFRRNRECRECLTPRPPDMGGEMGGGGDNNLMPGDWKCPKCQFKNFRRNSSCRKCSVKRPKDLEPYDDDGDYEPGDWKCPECNFRNFQRNKNCKECGTLSPDQSRKDDRWGVKKASGVASDGWGSNRSVQAAEKDGDRATGSGRTKHQEWKPDLNKEMSDDTDEELEENADVVFRRYDNDVVDVPRPKSKGFSKGAKGNGSSRGNNTDDPSLSDFGLSDLEDDSLKKSKKKGNKMGRKSADEEEEEDDVDDDNDMIDELSEDEETTSLAALKRATPAAEGRSFPKKWDDTASDDDLSDDDVISTPRTVVKQPLPKGRSFSKRWDDSDDDDDEEDEGFSDNDDDFGSSRGRGRGRGRGSGARGGIRGGRDSGNRGWRGSDGGSHRGENFGSRGDRGRHSSNFLESSGDEEEFSSRRGGGRGGRGLTRGGGDRGRHSSNLLESSGDEEEFSSRRGGGRGGRGLTRGGGDRGRRGSRFSDTSGDEEEFSRGRGGRGFRGGGGGRGRGGGGFSGGFFERGDRGSGRNRFENSGEWEGSRRGYESGRGRSFEGGRGSFGSRGRGGGRRGRS